MESRRLAAVLFSVSVAACSPTAASSGGGVDGGNGGGGDGGGGCVGLSCQVVDCAAMGKPATTITGHVYAPNQTLPLYGVNVYVPNGDPGPFTPGLSGTCDQCGDSLPGEPILQMTTDETGYFSLSGVPSGDHIPLVITSGKWRRQLLLTVPQCTSTNLAVADTSFPKSRTDMTANTKSVDMPQIGISTGSADALECLVRKLGIADSELTSDSNTPSGRVHLYADTGAGGGEGAASFVSGFAGGSGTFRDSETYLWSSFDKMKQYDILIFSCEGGQHPETKSQADMNAVKQYADYGGRVFLSHWHNIWVEGSTTTSGQSQAPMIWPQIAKFSDDNSTLVKDTVDTIDEADSPKGMSFATWMVNVMASPARDQIPLGNVTQGNMNMVSTGKNTCTSVDLTKGEEWVKIVNGQSSQGGAINGPQILEFTTPNEKDVSQRCGKVVFSDMHVSGDSTSPKSGTYPDHCATSGLTDQEKALAFMFFDIGSCVSPIIDKQL